MGNYGPLPGTACHQCGWVSTDFRQRACIYCSRISTIYRRFGTGRDHAHALVAKEVKAGRLPSAKSLECVDCGKPAIGYEHRDYNHPLVVEPICRACNTRRGPAIPLKQTFEEFIERVQRLYPAAREEHFESIRRLYWPDEGKK